MQSTLRARMGESLGAVRDAFSNRAIRRVQSAFAGSVVGQYAYVVAVSVFAFHHGGATAVGVFSFARVAVAAVVAPFAASISDRRRRELVMIGSDLARVITVAGAAAAVFTGAPSIVVYVLATLTTVFNTVFRPAEAALLSTLARSPEELTAANLTSSTLYSIGMFAGPALGAALLVAGGTGAVFCATAATFAWSACLLAGLHTAPPGAASEEAGEEHRGVWAGLRAIRAEPRLRLLVSLYGAQTLVDGALSVLLVASALSLLGMGNAGVGVLEASLGVGALVGSGVVLVLVGRKRLAADLGIGLAILGAPLAAIGVLPYAATAILAFAVVGLGNTMVDVSAVTLVQRAAPPEVAARVFGVLESVLTGTVGIGALIAPALIALIGVRSTLVAVGLVLPLVTALCWRRLAAIDVETGVPDDRLAAVRGVPFLSTLPWPGIESLAGRLQPVEAPAGKVLFERGDTGDRFYIVTEGAVEIDLPERVKLEQAPCYVGEIALLRDIPRTATVRASAPSVVWALEREDFLTAVRGHDRSHSAASEIASARLLVS